MVAKFYRALPLALALMVPPVVWAGVSSDLKDGMGDYKDDPVSKDDELGDPSPNVNFIILNAKAKAEGKSKAIVEGTMGGGGGGSMGNINSAVVGPGSTIRGDIIIIDESRGDKFNVVR